MAKRSAAILLYRYRNGLEVFLVHPGGPFWAKKDARAWSLPKGEYEADEDALTAAKRELLEETGFAIEGNYVALGEVKQAGGKIVTAWAVEGDLDPEKVKSNLFQMEWPPKSGRMREFPEVDKAGWFSPALAAEKLVQAQTEFVTRLQYLLSNPG
jgi:predicted NUDIX family NTP pyrophosphohydrolase